jgi:hypothetical protein
MSTLPVLKVRKLSAVALTLPNKTEAVLVQQGDDWNTLREYRCVSPAEFAGQTMITVPDQVSGGAFGRFLGGPFGRLPDETIIMASPALGAAITAAAPGNEP